MTERAREEYRLGPEAVAYAIMTACDDGDTPPIDLSRAEITIKWDEHTETLTLVISGPVDVH
jgi:hypothetical protein